MSTSLKKIKSLKAEIRKLEYLEKLGNTNPYEALKSIGLTGIPDGVVSIKYTKELLPDLTHCKGLTYKDGQLVFERNEYTSELQDKYQEKMDKIIAVEAEYEKACEQYKELIPVMMNQQQELLETYKSIMSMYSERRYTDVMYNLPIEISFFLEEVFDQTDIHGMSISRGECSMCSGEY